ncbi:hypothetical protein FSP39_023938 [Pinctada imbricata]|uniref:Glycerate kinase n=1 Tax=Pinctada imbricata TaxID=66713 RepID=A0AA89C103_PINIB|nr:hypothetical protein FSP39_023938 [Pinctada imbricata]
MMTAPDLKISLNPRENALVVFDAAIESVSPSKMIGKVLHVENGSLLVENREYSMNKNVHIVGFGKAVAGMARAVEERIGDNLVEGMISVPFGLQNNLQEAGKGNLLPRSGSRIRMYEGAQDNMPDEDAMKTAQLIQTMVRKLTKEDLLLVLISGGGSALLPLPSPGISLEETLELTKRVSLSGATISELNVIRRHIEQLKGGGLAREAYPAKVVSLILSDVVGDRLDIIASSPTVLDDTSPQMALDIMRRLGIKKEIPNSVRKYLKNQVSQKRWDPRDTDEKDKESEFIQNVIVGSNTMAAKAACEKAESLGYLPFLFSTTLEGDARERGKMFGKLAKFIAFSYGPRPSDDLRQTETELMQETELDKLTVNEILDKSFKAYSFGKGFCLIASGETTVLVKGKGRGGRNQEMAVACAMELNAHVDKLDKFNIEFLSGGTDGQDGPTDAAGAIVNQYFVQNCENQNLDIETYLENNDVFNLLSQVKNGSDLVKTGLTGTNVMDIHIILVTLKEKSA